jgi:hypothetical protein
MDLDPVAIRGRSQWP